jgi:ribonuclease VapC
MSPVNWLEAAISASRAGPDDMAALDAFVEAARMDIVAVDRRQMRLAHDAWRDYGKGRHPARLDLGDCFAYALAKSLSEPLLCKGGDFARTDVAAAI